MSKEEYLITDTPLKALTVFAMPMILQLSAEHFTPQYSHYTMLFGCRNCFLFCFRTFYNV